MNETPIQMTAEGLSKINERITKCEDNDKSFPQYINECFKNVVTKIDYLIETNNARLSLIETRITKNETDIKIYNSAQGRDVQVMAEKLDQKISVIEKVNAEQHDKINKIYWTVSILGALYMFLLPIIIWIINHFTKIKI